jgi:hypothetical protein
MLTTNGRKYPSLIERKACLLLCSQGRAEAFQPCPEDTERVRRIRFRTLPLKVESHFIETLVMLKSRARQRRFLLNT